MSTSIETDRPRTIEGGDPIYQDGKLTGRFQIKLDGGDLVECGDITVARAARSAMKEKQRVMVDLERLPGRPTPELIGLSIVTDMPPAAQSAPVASAPSSNVPARITPAPKLPDRAISNPSELTEQLGAMERHYNVLSPAIAVAQMAPGYGANMAIVRIDAKIEFDENKTSGAGADTYWSKSIHKDDGKRSLNKQGLLKISQAAGIQWDRNFCRRTDNGHQSNYWQWEYAGWIRTHDGQLSPVQGSRELDLRDGSAEAASMKPNQLQRARAFGNEICETKAMERAIRSLGIRQAYTVEELAKPFLIVRFSFTPDMDDPEIKKLVTERAISGIGALYPAAPPPAPPALPPATAENPFADTPHGTVAPAAQTSPAPEGQPQWPADAKFIAHVKLLKEGESGRGPWKLYEIAAKGGESWKTFNAEFVKDAKYAQEKGWPIRVTEEPSEKYPDQNDLKSVTIIDPRQQSLPMDGDKGKY